MKRKIPISAAAGVLLPLFFLFFLIGSFPAFLLPCEAYTEDHRITVLIDPGHHDGDTAGGTWSASRHESYYNMKVALACKAALDADGRFNAVLSHPDNNTPATLYERSMKADSVNADLIFSIHFDGIDGHPDMNGSEAFISVLPEFALEELAEMVLANLSDAVGIEARGIYQRQDTGDGEHLYYWDRERQWDIPDDRSAGPLSDYYGTLTWGAKLGIPAIIVEHGFMTNRHDRSIAENSKNLTAMGKADAQAIIDYYTNHTHNWETQRTVDYPSNCCMQGKASYRCTECGCRRKTVFLDPAPDKHWFYAEETVPATCTEGGYTRYVCRYERNLADKSDMEIEEDSITSYLVETEPLGHIMESVGHLGVCTVCGETVTPKNIVHTYRVTSRAEPTCLKPGKLVKTCAVCGETLTEILPASGHSYSVTEDTAATCTEAGVLVRTCSGCGDEIREVFPALGHVWTDGAYEEPVCTADGFHSIVCSVCGAEERTVIPRLEHAWDAGSVSLEPTLFHEGTLLFSCANNPAHTYTRVIPARITEPEVFRTVMLWAAGGITLFLLLFLLMIFLIIRHRKKKKAASAAVSSVGEADGTVCIPLSDVPEDIRTETERQETEKMSEENPAEEETRKENNGSITEADPDGKK